MANGPATPQVSQAERCGDDDMVGHRPGIAATMPLIASRTTLSRKPSIQYDERGAAMTLSMTRRRSAGSTGLCSNTSRPEPTIGPACGVAVSAASPMLGPRAPVQT
ncbi:hypothetical protein QO011_002375 [Labrys wisconsinensis]|uniref:Uncharacterized protein n=1 Tax=Labrys wisconsinensis TaxID=425677 RepID=A0ABU0J7X3_9HYPH|nr:hypothetical protein [Labrys wisconsinensis]MDQ0469364.1 hypothetical protein [Labrys wisconsinensis]